MTKEDSRLATILGGTAPPVSKVNVVEGEMLSVDGVRVITTAEAARILGLSRSRVQQINADGAFTNYVAGGVGSGGGAVRLLPYDEVVAYSRLKGKSRKQLLDELRAARILVDPPMDPFTEEVTHEER